MFSPCSAKIRASEKDLPVTELLRPTWIFNYERTLCIFSFSLSRPLNSTLVNKVDEVFRNRWRTLLSVDEMVDKECAHRILNCYLSNSSSGFTNFLYRFLYFCWVLGHLSKPTIWQMRLTRAR